MVVCVCVCVLEQNDDGRLGGEGASAKGAKRLAVEPQKLHGLR